MEIRSKYIDQEYHFKGKWDIPSICGLKIIRKDGDTIVIATNFYERNPGTSISRWSAELAMLISAEFGIKTGELIFIEHNPDRKSKLDFYKQTFDIIHFEREGSKLSRPNWTRVTKKEVDKLIQ